jgi:hypothetical protein
MSKPDCHKCVNHDPLPMTHHIQCLEPKALISGNARAAQKGWFHWPWNFDPIWLEECNKYEEKAPAPYESSIGFMFGDKR